MKSGDRLDAIVRIYRQRKLKKALDELESFSKEATVEAAASRAGLAQRWNPDRQRWVRYDHQRRIPRRVLKLARKRLLATRLTGFRTFHDLFLTVESAIGDLDGVGELMVYDTALRIGRRLRREPDRVYLHSGTRVGARRLGLDTRTGWIERERLPMPLRALPPWQVEDILCIFKDWFRGDRRLTSGCT